MSRAEFFKQMRKEIESAYDWTEELVGISTGSLAVDRILGKVGGFPRKRMTEVMGWESSGKTTLCLQACAQAQKSKLHATYIDTERAVDLQHARLLNFDFENPEKGAYLTPRTLEETFTIIEGLITEVKTDLLIVDSIAAMIPQSAMDADMSDVSPLALRARFLSDKLPRVANIASQHNVAVVFVNQLRMKIQTGWGAGRGKPQEHSTGGSALRFYASLRLELKQIKKNNAVKKVTDPVSGKEIDVPIQGLHSAYAFKNKVSDPYQTTDFYIRFDPDNNIYGVDNLQTVIDAAKAQDVLVEKKAGYVAFEGTLGFKVHGGNQLYQYLIDHTDALDEIRTQLRAKAGLF